MPAEVGVASQRAGLQSLIDEEESRLEAPGFTSDNLLAEPCRPLTPETMRLLAGLLEELYANIAKHADPGGWYAICVTFDTDAIHVSASDTIASDDTRLGLGSGLDRYGPSSKHAAAPSKPTPNKPTGNWRPLFQSMATGKTCIRRPAMSSNRMTAYSRRIATHFG